MVLINAWEQIPTPAFPMITTATMHVKLRPVDSASSFVAQEALSPFWEDIHTFRGQEGKVMDSHCRL